MGPMVSRPGPTLLMQVRAAEKETAKEVSSTRDSSAAADIVVVYFKIVGIGYVLNTVTNCFLGSMNGMGRPAKSMLCMVLYYIIIRMLFAWLLSHSELGINGIWTAVLISHLIAAAAAAAAAVHELLKRDL